MTCSVLRVISKAKYRQDEQDSRDKGAATPYCTIPLRDLCKCHPGGGRDPGGAFYYWIPVFTGMTKWRVHCFLNAILHILSILSALDLERPGSVSNPRKSSPLPRRAPTS